MDTITLRDRDVRWKNYLEETAARLGIELRIEIIPCVDSPFGYDTTIHFSLGEKPHVELDFKQACEELEDWADGYRTRNIEAESYRRDEIEVFGDMSGDFVEYPAEAPTF